ncbi:BFD-like [2Fe-2S] binding domain-containing protein [Saccharicrinis carchari]|uniref:BFD-like [2Fe-2S] binding domain-containing protein n=1 Tax=Saccharicrinis carchari TaxID=1168039 RepID=A0A521B5M3_SACCC|nr:(2Fe-2S)-binding protein [Saccharicrinis carchari]SMO42402.1 BFD-like [2Fe-2S] binding domain-containing protein [Saccharicrinis carchari]
MSKFKDRDFVCKHMMLRKQDLVKAIHDKQLKTVDDVQDETGAATICGACYDDVEEILHEELEKERKLKLLRG